MSKNAEHKSNEYEYYLEYDDFVVVRDKTTKGFYFYDYADDDYCEVYPIAQLQYSMNDCIMQNVSGEDLSEIFDCYCCGEDDRDLNSIKYYWFEKV